MKLATWNVNGVRARATELVRWIDREEPDVICLQEIKAGPAQVPAMLTELPGYHTHWHGAGGYSGVALLVRAAWHPAAPVITHPPFDHEHRIAVAELGGVRVGSVYVPNGGKDVTAKLAFLDAMVGWAGEHEAAGTPLVLAGDFNVARTELDVHPALRTRGLGQSERERARIEALFGYGLVDVARRVAPDDDRLFTWWAPWRDHRVRNLGWRLDYVAASTGLVDETVHCVTYRDVGTSDHGPVIAHLRDAPAG